MNRFHKFWVGTTTVLLTAVMLTSCGGGTSSNTGGGQAQNNNNNPQPGPQTLTVTVPSLGYVQTIDKNTTFGDILSAARDASAECLNRFGVSAANNTCQAEARAAQSQAINFINR
ncbi:MAG: hypothetical protein ACKPB9_29000, partial [Dolichospermum sp.]